MECSSRALMAPRVQVFCAERYLLHICCLQIVSFDNNTITDAVIVKVKLGLFF